MDIKNVNGAANNSNSSAAKNNVKSANETASNVSSNTASDPLKNTISQLKNDDSQTRDVTVDDIDAIGEKAGKEILKSYGVPEQVLNKVDTKNFDKISPAKKINDAGNKKAKEKLAKTINKNPQLKKAFNGLSNAVGRPTNTSSESQEMNQDFDNNQNLDVNTNSDSTDILGKIGNFIKNNPGLVATIAINVLIVLLVILLVVIIASAVMYVIDQLSNIVKALEDVGQTILNGITLNGFRTNQNVYLFNIEETSSFYMTKADKTTVDEEKITYYVNTTTFYSNVVNPDAIDEVLKDKDNNTNDKRPAQIENEEDLTDTFIGSSSELRNKYGSIKADPKDLIKNMFKCGVYKNDLLVEGEKCSGDVPSGTNEKWYFSEEKYEKYLLETYVPQKFINCDSCAYKDLDSEKKNAVAKKMTDEILSQAKTFYSNHNANDQSNYNIYNLSVSGITVKDVDGNVIGVFSLAEYVETIVERDAGSYNDEIKKAYALNVISELLSRISNSEIIEENFDKEIVTDSTRKAVEDVKDLKIMKDGKVYYNVFDFEKAQTVEPQDYESILKALFGEDIKMEKSISDGLQLDPITGFYMRVEKPSSDLNSSVYQHYYTGSSYIGECAWYATKRAQEITRTLGVTEWWGSPSGGYFCTSVNTNASSYNTCWPSKGEKCTPKQGSIVSWSYGEYGHVAIIEKVNEDGTYNISHADVAKGGYAKYKGYKYVSQVWDAFERGEVTRLNNCIGYGNTGCFKHETVTYEKLMHIHDNYDVVCFIDLTNPK